MWPKPDPVMMGFHDTRDTRVRNLYLRSKITLLLHKSTNSISALIIFFKSGSSQLREWLRDCVRDCWQAVWKIFQLWWIGRLLISRWVFVVSRLNYPQFGLPGLYRPRLFRPIRGPGWGESTNEVTQFWHATCIQKVRWKSFFEGPLCKQSLVKSTCVGLLRVRHHHNQLMIFRTINRRYVCTVVVSDTWHVYCQVSRNNLILFN